MIVYELTKEDLTSLGAMWAKPTFVWRKLYSEIGFAQSAGSIDYGDIIEWEKEDTWWTSGVLQSVMYTIEAIEVIN